MDHIIMVLQILNEVYLKIIVLSFLIAVVGRSFATQMKTAIQNQYQQRCEMNNESAIAMRLIGLLQESEVLVLSAQFEKADGPDKVEVLREELKGEILDTRKEIQDMKDMVLKLRK